MSDLDFVAVDIGYGETKVAWINALGTVLESFRSIARPAPEADLGADLPSRAKSLREVWVEDRWYYVGQDAVLAGDANAVQPLHADFIHTPSYLACYHAALAATEARRIRTLVTGLPVYQCSTLRNELERLLTGPHLVRPNYSTTVDRVVVVPQPMGGIMEVARHAALNVAINDLTLLILDVGQGTTDWVTVIHGHSAVKRSGSHPVGVGAIIEGVRRRLLTKYHGAPRDTDLAESLKRGRKEIMVGSKQINIEAEISASAREIVEMCMTSMQNTVQTFSDINYVAIVGGGAALIRPAFTRALQGTKIELLEIPEPEFANVRGYLSLAHHIRAVPAVTL